MSTLWKILQNNSIQDTEVNSELFLGSILFDNDKFKIYKSNIQDFITNIVIWSCQRSLNIDHVALLKESILKRGFLMGTFKVIRDSDGNVRCIDGQHRIAALRQILLTDADYNCDIIIEVFQVEKLESEIAMQLFQDSNNTMNLSGKDSCGIVVQKVIEYMVSTYPTIMVDVKEGKRCNRPKINKKMVVEKIKIWALDYDSDLIISHITDYNIKLGTMTKAVLVSIAKNPISDIMHDTCRISGCYLGLLPDCNWIDKLNFK